MAEAETVSTVSTRGSERCLFRWLNCRGRSKKSACKRNNIHSRTAASSEVHRDVAKLAAHAQDTDDCHRLVFHHREDSFLIDEAAGGVGGPGQAIDALVQSRQPVVVVAEIELAKAVVGAVGDDVQAALPSQDGDLVGRVHRVVAADVEEIPNVVRPEDLEAIRKLEVSEPLSLWETLVQRKLLSDEKILSAVAPECASSAMNWT